MNQTMFETGIEKGIEEGIERGRVELVTSLLEDRFGASPDTIRPALERLSADELRRLALKIPNAPSLSDLGLTEP